MVEGVAGLKMIFHKTLGNNSFWDSKCGRFKSLKQLKNKWDDVTCQLCLRYEPE